MERALQALELRMNQMFVTDRYPKLVETPVHEGKQCHEYDNSKLYDIFAREIYG